MLNTLGQIVFLCILFFPCLYIFCEMIAEFLKDNPDDKK